MDETTVTAQTVREELYDVVRKEVPFQQKAREALELGKQYLGADNGHLTQIDQETDHWEIIATTDPADGQFPPDLELDLGTTYCRRVITANSQIALHDAPNEGWDGDPAFETHGLHCYHGTPLVLNGEPYGTVCFVSENPRDQFTDGEKMFAELIAQLLERELEREQHKDELTRQSNLAIVLNRVLRHNLRNDISVIRGFMQMMTDKLDNPPESEVALRHIDDLIKLADKARQLDRIVGSDFNRKSTELTALIEEIVEPITDDYPNASVSIEYDERIIADVLPSFERALSELIENAVKHAGDSPTVTVSATLAPNTVEIQIADNGPGLDGHEANVLQTGSETPLTHGSGLGLWLSHWIITSHNGSIDATVTDGGTTMTISIPRKPTSDVQQQLTELQRGRDQYQAAFQESTDAMIMLNAEAQIIDANPAASSIYGLERHALLGQPIQRFLPDEFDFEQAWREFQNDGPKSDIVTIVGADGVERQVEYSATTDVIPSQHLVVSRDITKRVEREEQLETERRKFRSLAEVLPYGLYRADPDTLETVYANEAFKNIHGYSSEEWPDIPNQWEASIHPADAASVVDTFQTRRESADSGQLEYRIQTDDGETRWIEDTFTWETDADGNATALVGVYTDITERKEQEKRLRTTTTQLEALFNDSPDMIDVLDPEGTILDVNRRFCEELGYDENEVVGRPIWEIDQSVEPDDVTSLLSEFTPGERRKFEGEYERRDGSLLPIEVHLLRLELNGDDRFLAISRDITDRKDREWDLEFTKELLANTECIADVGGWEIDTKTNEVFWTDHLFEMLGVKDEEEPSLDEALDVFIEEDRPRVEQAVEEAIATGEPFDVEARFRRPNGELRRCSICSEPIIEGGEVVALRGMVQDITDRRRDERACTVRDLTEREEQEKRLDRSAAPFELAVEGAGLRVWNWDKSTDNAKFNDKWTGGIGHTVEAIEPRLDAWETRVHPDDLDDVEAALQAHIDDEAPYYDTEYRIETTDGNLKWIRDIGKVIERNDAGEPIRAVGIHLDVTEQKQREQELDQHTTRLEEVTSQLEEQYRYLFEQAPVMEVVTRVENERPIIEDCNQLFVETLGYNKDDVLEQELAEFYTDDSRRRLLNEEGYERALNGEFVREDRELVTADGETIKVLLRAVPRYDAHMDVDGTLAFYIDISERRELEQEKKQLEEFTSIVSHDLRNPLNVAEGRVELVRDECDSEHLDHAQKALDRMEGLIDDLLQLAKSGDHINEIVQIDLEMIVESCWQNVETADATLVTEIERSIKGDPSRVSQLFENLFRNAVEHGGADVTITVGELDDGFYVEDDGPGILKADRGDVFEAGYSTSKDGTGFGLSIVRQVAEAHGWTINVTDGSEGGARFEVAGVEIVAN